MNALSLSLFLSLSFSSAALLVQPRTVEAKPAQADATTKEAERLEGEVERLFRAGKYDAALPLAERRLAILEKALGPDHKDAANAASDVAALFHMKSDYARAEPLYARSLAALEKALGPDHPDVATTVNNLAELFKDQGDYARAEPLYLRVIAAYEKAFGPDSAEVALAVQNLGQLYKRRGDYARAEPLYLRALAIREKVLGPESPETATTLNDLANLHDDQGDYARAEPLHLRALAIGEKALGPDHPNLAVYLNSFALMHKLKGDFAKAEPLYLRALAIREKTSGPESPKLTAPLHNLASLYKAQGDYARAEPLQTRALQIAEKAYGPDHPTTADIVTSLGLLHRARNDYARAEPLLTRALAIREKAFGPDHAAVADALNNLALVYRFTGDYARAEPLLTRALAIYQKALGPDHPKVGTAQNNLASLALARGDYDRAEALHKQALATTEKKLGGEHPSVALSLQNMAVVDIERGRFDQAEQTFARALVIYEKALGPSNPESARTLQNIAAMRFARGDTKGAVEALDRSTDMRDRHASMVLAAGSEEQKRLFMAELRWEMFQTIHFAAAAKPGDKSAATLAARTILRRKGRVLDAAASSVAALRSRLDPRDHELLDELAKVRSELAGKVLHGSSSGASGAGSRRAEIQALEDRMQALEAQISQRSAAFRADDPRIAPEQVQAALPANSALVEVVAYRPFNHKAPVGDRWGKARYAAFVLRRTGDPAFVDLGEAAVIDAQVEALRRALSDPALDPKPAGRKLDALVMQPLAAHLGDATSLYMSPDGALNLIPFAALVSPDGEYLLRRFAFTYLTSGRDLLRRAASAATPLGEGAAVVIANPDFGASPTGAGKASGEGGARASSSQLRGITFPPLPGTAREGAVLGRKMAGARVLSGLLATEEEVKKVRGPRILHLATHGFFLPSVRAFTKAGTRGLVLDGPPAGSPGSAPGGSPDDVPEPLQSPLLRSGIALAKVNALGSGGENGSAIRGDDGVLTALEAAGLNLHGTRLVVLSACETAVGEAQDGEGVYGLRRALVLAGSETQVMSLWKVDDDATQRLMVDYYDRLLAGGGRSASMRDVQLAMLSEEALRHPYYWASFIVSGNGDPLNGPAASPPPARVPPGARGCGCALEDIESSDPSGSGLLAGVWIAAAGAALFTVRIRRGARSVQPTRLRGK